ncbi:hypothetical protein XENOCAPTIV_022886 [Xenoophorus captivus]|uniref:Uncharacterized protein n=1 Tax=Xenoophorus captivus TaxID=1517983 RepID=A0ABV0SBD1_9TELE
MNSMMGALQELKLLQVQTALESLDISGRPINRGIPHPASTAPSQPLVAAASGLSGEHKSVLRQTMPEEPSTSPVPSPKLSLNSRNSLSREDQTSSRNRSSMGTFSSSASSRLLWTNGWKPTTSFPGSSSCTGGGSTRDPVQPLQGGAFLGQRLLPGQRRRCQRLDIIAHES